MSKQIELIDLDADTQRKQPISPETFLNKYNIWVKRCGLLEDIRRVSPPTLVVGFDHIAIEG
jgi:hypothetical protein